LDLPRPKRSYTFLRWQQNPDRKFGNGSRGSVENKFISGARAAQNAGLRYPDLDQKLACRQYLLLNPARTIEADKRHRGRYCGRHIAETELPARLILQPSGLGPLRTI
jgi:hypothetical protein